MIYSRDLPQQQPRTVEHRPPMPKVPENDDPLKVKVVKSVDTPFGSVYTYITLDAVNDKNEVLRSKEFKVHSWELNSARMLAQVYDFEAALRKEGFNV